MPDTHAVLITVESLSKFHNYDGYNVKIGGVQAYWRAYDGSDADDVLDEACKTLGELLRAKLGRDLEKPEDDDRW